MNSRKDLELRKKDFVFISNLVYTQYKFQSPSGLFYFKKVIIKFGHIKNSAYLCIVFKICKNMSEWIKQQNNMIHVSKGVYFIGNCPLWKVYRRAINCDGHYTPFTKSDVAHIMLTWCNDNRDVIKDHRIKDLMSFHDALKDEQRRFLWYGKANADIDDCVVYICHSIMQMTEVKMFDEVIMPSDDVLPYSIDPHDLITNDITKRKGIMTKEVVDERKRHIEKHFKEERGAVENNNPFAKYTTPLWECIFDGDLTYEHNSYECDGISLDASLGEVRINNNVVATIDSDGKITPLDEHLMIHMNDKGKKAMEKVMLSINYNVKYNKRF